MANLEGINRASKKGFADYMMANPVYFEQQFGLAPTKENILKAHKEAMRLRKSNPFFPASRGDFHRTYRASRRMAA